MKILFIINLKAGKRAHKDRLLEEIGRLCKDHNIEIRITQGIKDAYDVIYTKGNLYDAILVSGGDGTIHEVTCALKDGHHDTPFGVYPLGTVNDFANIHELNFKKTTDQVLLNAYKKIDIAKFNDTWFDYVAGFGAFCDVSYSTKRQDKELFGSLAYIVKGIADLPNIRPHHIEIKTEEMTYSGDVLFGLVLLGHRAAGIDIFKKEEAHSDDGFLDVIIIEYTPNILELYNYLIGILGNKAKYVTRFKCKELSFKSEDLVKWTLDGEDGGILDEAKIMIDDKGLSLYK